MIVGLDPGAYETKLVTKEGAFKMLSCLGEYRNLKIEKKFLEEDIVYEHEGKKGFACRLAIKESLFKRRMAGDTKAHEDALIRILIALHRFTNDTQFDLVVNQPIVKHTKDKEKIIQMLKGKHSIKVNGHTKTFYINNVSVAPEGAIAYWAIEKSANFERIIDIGSGTVNAATIVDGEFIDLESFTLVFGANSEESYNIKDLAEAIKAECIIKRWKKTDEIRICGGVSPLIKDGLGGFFKKVEIIQPRIRVGNGIKQIAPVYANAVGCYELACELYEQ